MIGSSCDSGARSQDRFLTRATGPNAPTIVVTFPVTAALVAQLVGDAANVQVLMPNGVDPHEYRPSARDIEAMSRADLVVANGFGLEEGLTAALDHAEGTGTPVFWFSDWVKPRRIDGANDPHDDEHDSDGPDDGHDHGSIDPHFWVDPVMMAGAMAPLAEMLENTLDLDLSGRLVDVEAELEDLDHRVTTVLDVVPPENRDLVTGHESLGYFADRYGFEIVGTVVNSLSSQASPSAADIATLKRQIESLGVKTIFIEAGAPKALSNVIADETGVLVIELNTHKLPDDRSYSTFMIDLASGVAAGLGSRP